MDIDDFLKLEKFKDLDKFLTEEMYRIAGKDMVDEVIDCVGSEDLAKQWFYSKNSELNNERPYDYWLDGKQKEIEEMIIKAGYGIP